MEKKNLLMEENVKAMIEYLKDNKSLTFNAEDDDDKALITDVTTGIFEFMATKLRDIKKPGEEAIVEIPGLIEVEAQVNEEDESQVAVLATMGTDFKKFVKDDEGSDEE